MAINLKNTNQVRAQGVKILVYGKRALVRLRSLLYSRHPVGRGSYCRSGTGYPYIEIDSIRRW